MNSEVSRKEKLLAFKAKQYSDEPSNDKKSKDDNEISLLSKKLHHRWRKRGASKVQNILKGKFLKKRKCL